MCVELRAAFGKGKVLGPRWRDASAVAEWQGLVEGRGESVG